MTLATARPGCLVVRCDREITLPGPKRWATQILSRNATHGYRTWLRYDPSIYRLVRVLAPQNESLHHQLTTAGAHLVVARPDHSVYLLPVTSDHTG